ncbi:GNAT family N-acetyltransferase [Shouchella clausii]|uniref:GNAT family N-acetyltransferase n=1 Tax=Shouchella clausii TaxID=79880 RepID=UPI00270F1547|nr:GNAT family N-acetyltransferase [Shouchella clausii]MDO7266961.1 GNAT family N-acetyltransferase [Shouchella clausii]MDO7286124.1 GNAT family N-acetyltransferase [Shouchella clausii]
MTIHRLTDKDFEQAFQLSCYAFQVENPDDHRQRAQKAWDRSINIGATENGQLLSKLALLPLAVHIHGKTMPMGGLAGVASYPEQRRKGHVRQLLGHTLQTMRAEGHLLSYLAPFSVSFYRKFGWEILCEKTTYTLNAKQLPKPLPIADGKLERVDPSDPRICAVYEKRLCHGMLVRDPQWWDHLQNGAYKAKKAVLYIDAAGEPSAYMIYTIQKRNFTTEELIFGDQKGLNALFAFIGQHDSMADTAELTVPAAEGLSYFLPDAKTKAETIPYFMARIVDVAPFFQAYPFLADGQGDFVFRISDPVAEWNDRLFAFSVKNGKAHPTTVGGDEPVFETDIQTLTALMLGYKRPTFFKHAGFIRGDEKALQDFFRLIPGEQPALVDFF